MKKILTTIAIIIFGTGTVAGAIFYRQGLDKDTEINAHRTQIATLNDQLSKLDKNRETLQKQIAETIEQLNALKNNNQYIIKLESIIEKKEATIVGDGSKVPCAAAAFANGTLADILDWEDCSWTGHPSAGAIPAALAMGELVKASGKRAA